MSSLTHHCKSLDEDVQDSLAQIERLFPSDEEEQKLSRQKKLNQKLLAYEDIFRQQISKIIKERKDFITYGIQPQVFRDDLLNRIPQNFSIDRIQWPKRTDLSWLNYDQLQEFRLTEFQFWDAELENKQYNFLLAFCFSGTNNLKSPIVCPNKHPWMK